MHIEQLETFLYVAMTGSYSKAGEILYISQPAVSARMKALEKELGSPLFERKDNQIKLTAEGQAFYPHAKKGLESIQEGLTNINQLHSQLKGKLSIAVVLTLTNYFIPDVLKDFLEKYPDIELTINTGHSKNVLDMVLNHEVALGIARSVNHPLVESIDLMQDNLEVTVYPDHPFAKATEEITLAEFMREPLFFFKRGTLDRTLLNSALDNLNIEPNVVIETDNINLVKQMIKNKMGIGIIPQSFLQKDIKEGSLCTVKIKNLPQLPRPVQLIYLRETKIEGLIKAFTAFLLKKARNSDYAAEENG